MIFKILKEYIRRISRNYKIYAISILGMSIAIIASFHIYHFVYKELSVDGFHTKKKDIYRVNCKWGNNSNFRVAITPNPLGPLLKEKLPEVKDYTRFQHNSPIEFHFNRTSELRQFAHADPSFFELFNFSIIEGSLKKFKETPNGIFLTQKIAKELFKDENPIGEVLTISDYKSPNKRTLEVIGVIENFSKTSTIQAEAIINFQDYEKNVGGGWSSWSPSLYLHIPLLTDAKQLATKISNELFDERNRVANGYTVKEKTPFYLQRFDKIYFNSNNIKDQEEKGSLQFIKVVSLIGILVLLFGALNYVIMNIGLNSSRIKEFTTKRYLGASKKTILMQLISESILNVLIVLVIAFASYPLLNTYISELIGFDYLLSLTSDVFILFTFFCLVLAIGLVIGFIEFLISYSTIILSINTNLKNAFNLSNKYIIGFQLVLSIATIISILAIKKQVDYIESKDIGFDIHNIISIPTMKYSDEIKGLLQSKSFVNSIARGQNLFRTDFRASNTKLVELDKEIDAIVIQGDNNYLKTHKIELLQGKNLNPLILSNNVKEHFDGERKMKLRNNNSLIEVLVNETFVKKANLKNPIGTVLTNDYATGSLRKGVIVGVFKDVYNLPLYYPVQPIIFGFDFTGYPNIFQVSYNPEYKNQLQNDILTFFKSKGFDDKVLLRRLIGSYNHKDIYKKELQLKRSLEAFTMIVLFISLLGMIAISLFITESKIKEIGIRKVNGATINEIMLMLNKDFIKWVVIAFVIACPIAYYAISKWLENFAYKTALSWWVFVLAGVFILVIALLTVSLQTYRAATRNPVESLRDE
ncbi:ABC transporter permease [Flavivirga rizhaonensis]|uniref:ABC transporter permease n=1 Tax=Flavivirga rizhaonensis TaxID=2559571 RepID=A0A4S1DZG9_9FLAO|nr:ABC transporter permease [Flavivirga rizhaonensis]TGV03413.1 ABC transporter permease [Flavivirga rizhaonensis]